MSARRPRSAAKVDGYVCDRDNDLGLGTIAVSLAALSLALAGYFW